MTQSDVRGWDENPAALLQAEYERIAVENMQGMSFCNAEMPVKVELSLFEGQWIGCVLTPWMLSAIVLPGPQQSWLSRDITSRIALKLPCGDITFMVGELDGIGQLLSSSLMSPLQAGLTVEQGIRMVQDCHKMLLSLPVNQGVDNPARRSFLMREAE